MFPGHSRSGIIVASINEILHNFTGLVGYHDIKDRQSIIDDMLGSKGQYVKHFISTRKSRKSSSKEELEVAFASYGLYFLID